MCIACLLSRLVWDWRDSWIYFRTAFGDSSIASGSGVLEKLCMAGEMRKMVAVTALVALGKYMMILLLRFLIFIFFKLFSLVDWEGQNAQF